MPLNMVQLEGLHAADIVNGLNIKGELFSVCRGKELVIAIDRVSSIYNLLRSRNTNDTLSIFQFIIRVGYALEAHSFWIPTDIYSKITSSSPIQRGKKSKTFLIPEELYDGPPDSIGQISIQAAFVCPDWTLIFADHNVMVTFHVMALRYAITKEDLLPSSKVCGFFMSMNSSHYSFGSVDLALYMELQAWCSLLQRT